MLLFTLCSCAPSPEGGVGTFPGKPPPYTLHTGAMSQIPEGQLKYLIRDLRLETL